MILITLDKTTLVGTPLNLNKDIKDDWLHHKTALKSAKFKWNDKKSSVRVPQSFAKAYPEASFQVITPKNIDGFLF